MFENLDIFRMSSAMARHAGQRQAIVAQNVANADTPDFAARDLPPFHAVYQSGDEGDGQRATRRGHLHGSIAGAQGTEPIEKGVGGEPNGNKVSLETEMLKSVDAMREHDRALAIYKSALGILRSTIRS